MAATARSDELRALAQAVADALPPSVLEVVVTGSVSRGADCSGADRETASRLPAGSTCSHFTPIARLGIRVSTASPGR